LEEAVPELRSAVGRETTWRMIAVLSHTNPNIDKRNPFEYVTYKKPDFVSDREEDSYHIEKIAEYLKTVRKTKEESYQKAKENPLTRLAAWLCREPILSWDGEEKPVISAEAGGEEEEELFFHEIKENLYFNSYQEEAVLRRDIRESIRNGVKQPFALPTEFLCLALRVEEDEKDRLKNLWNETCDRAYSAFCEWNLYTEKQRFAVFDMKPLKHSDHQYHYLRFLATLMLLAGHDLPGDLMQPGKVYVLDSDANEESLQYALSFYDTRLSETQKELKERIATIQSKEPKHFTDKEMRARFLDDQYVEVTLPEPMDQEEVMISPERIPVVTEDRNTEISEWMAGFKRSIKALQMLLKQPQRGVNQTVNDLREREDPDMKGIENLTRFQIDDLNEFTQKEEMETIRSDTEDLYHIETYRKRLDEKNKNVKKALAGRIEQKTVGILALIVAALTVLGFVPTFISNVKVENALLLTTLILAVSLGSIALVGYLTLLFLRREVESKFYDYNNEVLAIGKQISESLQSYSIYLTHIANTIKGYRYVRFRQEIGDPDRIQISILQKHICDMQLMRENIRLTFGTFLKSPVYIDLEPEELFHYDFTKPCDYAYPIEYVNGAETGIEFFQTGEYIKAPVDFIIRLRIRREELYDR